MAASRRETIRALLNHEIPERMGVNEAFWPFIVENAWGSQGLTKGTDFVARFDLDIRCVEWKGLPEPRPDLRAVLEETAEWKTERDGWGGIKKTWKTKAGTPEHVGFTIDSPEVWRREFRDAVLALDMLASLDRAKLKQGIADARREDRFVTFSFMHVFEYLRHVFGHEQMLQWLLLEPELIHDFNRIVTDKFLGYYQVLFAEVGLPDGIHLYEDLGYTQAPFCSPGCHREMIHPYHRQLFGFFKDRGLPVIVHTCGDFRPHLPALVEAGADCIQALEAKTGMDVVVLAREWKDRLCFMGNLDVRTLESNDRARIRDEVERKLKGMRQLRAPYIFMSDHSISPAVPLAAYEYALDCYRRNCRY